MRQSIFQSRHSFAAIWRAFWRIFMLSLIKSEPFFKFLIFSLWALFLKKKLGTQCCKKCFVLRSQEMDQPPFKLLLCYPYTLLQNHTFGKIFFYLGLSWKKLNWNYIAFLTTIQVTENVWIFAPKMFLHILNKKINVASVCSPP